MNNFTMQTIEFVNATLENTGSVGSIDITTIISIATVVIAFLALFIAGLTLWLTHLKSMSISLHPGCELPELSKGEFNMNVPTSLRVKGTLLVLNSGNRAGVIKDLKLEFNPQPHFEEFYGNKEVEGYSIRSAKTNQPLDSTVSIKDQDTDLVIFSGHINLDLGISMDHHIGNLDIESNNLETLLKKMPKCKKEKLKKFINFLKKNKKLGDFTISYSYTKPKLISRRITFENKDIPLEVRHSYKKTIKCYEDISLEKYQQSIRSKEIIKGISKTITALEDELDGCRKKIEEHPKDAIFPLRHNSNMIESISKNENEYFKLLSKCSNYQKTIEDDVEPILKCLVDLDKQMQATLVSSTNELRESLKDDIENKKEELKEQLKKISPKLKKLKKEVENELEEIGKLKN